MINNIFDEFFDLQSIPYYCLGLGSFLIHLFTELLNKNKKSFRYYIQDFLYAIISIIIGISICYICEFSKSVNWIILICCGMFGSTVIRIISDKKDNITITAVDKLTEKITEKTSEAVGEKIYKSEKNTEIKEEIIEEDNFNI